MSGALPTTFTIALSRPFQAKPAECAMLYIPHFRNTGRESRPRPAPRIELEGRAAGRTAPPIVRDLVRDEVCPRSNLGREGRYERLDGPDGTLDPARIDHLAEQISLVMDQGRKVALVSSGAVGAGMGQLGWKRRPDNLRQLQAAAAVGQAYLIRAYDEGLRRHRRHAAQLLLTHEDFDSRPRYLNMRNTLHALFECDAVPIINENDTISVDEIKLGDNDQLAAMVTNLLQAPLLVILSVVDGLYRVNRWGQPMARSSRWSPRSTNRCSRSPAAAEVRTGPAECRASWRQPAG